MIAVFLLTGVFDGAAGPVDQIAPSSGAGAYIGHERAAAERKRQNDSIKEAVRKAYRGVVGEPAISTADPEKPATPRATKAQIRNITSQVSQRLAAAEITMAQVQALIREIEAEMTAARLLREEDEIMMVMLNA